MDELSLKTKGEELAKLAVEHGLGSKQLRDLYKITKTKPLPMVEVHIKRQITRVSGRVAFESVLELLSLFANDKASFLKILWYANMLYSYYDKQTSGRFDAIVGDAAAKVCAQRNCRYRGVETSGDGHQKKYIIRVIGYVGDLSQLAMEITREIMNKAPNFSEKIWIQPIDRR
ncbi:MAG: hypothetical protein N3D85_07430 [Candidatus Bathyarchaeota archaeon]|nr:hypothetical protein [Candidatus Bathyarchaeota archaeon]